MDGLTIFENYLHHRLELVKLQADILAPLQFRSLCDENTELIVTRLNQLRIPSDAGLRLAEKVATSRLSKESKSTLLAAIDKRSRVCPSQAVAQPLPTSTCAAMAKPGLPLAPTACTAEPASQCANFKQHCTTFEYYLPTWLWDQLLDAAKSASANLALLAQFMGLMELWHLQEAEFPQIAALAFLTLPPTDFMGEQGRALVEELKCNVLAIRRARVIDKTQLPVTYPPTPDSLKESHPHIFAALYKWGLAVPPKINRDNLAQIRALVHGRKSHSACKPARAKAQLANMFTQMLGCSQHVAMPAGGGFMPYAMHPPMLALPAPSLGAPSSAQIVDLESPVKLELTANHGTAGAAAVAKPSSFASAKPSSSANLAVPAWTDGPKTKPTWAKLAPLSICDSPRDATGEPILDHVAKPRDKTTITELLEGVATMEKADKKKKATTAATKRGKATMKKPASSTIEAVPALAGATASEALPALDESADSDDAPLTMLTKMGGVVKTTTTTVAEPNDAMAEPPSKTRKTTKAKRQVEPKKGQQPIAKSSPEPIEGIAPRAACSAEPVVPPPTDPATARATRSAEPKATSLAEPAKATSLAAPAGPPPKKRKTAKAIHSAAPRIIVLDSPSPPPATSSAEPAVVKKGKAIVVDDPDSPLLAFIDGPRPPVHFANSKIYTDWRNKRYRVYKNLGDKIEESVWFKSSPAKEAWLKAIAIVVAINPQ